MWSKKTFLSAAIVLTLTSIANADLALTVNGLDTANEIAEIKGKDNLVIAVAGRMEAKPNAYFIKVSNGAIEATAGANTVSTQAGTGDYSFSFEDESDLSTVDLTANKDMVIDGTSVKEGDTIYELVLVYVSETDTVMAFGANLEGLNYTPAEPEPELQSVIGLQPELKAEAVFEHKPALEPQPKIFQPLPEQRWIQQTHQKTARLYKTKSCPQDTGSSILRDWGLEERWKTEATATLEGHPAWSKDFAEAGAEGGGQWMSTLGETNSTAITIPDGTIINTNTIWESDVNVLGDVYVENAMLIIKPGVIVRFSCGAWGITVRNNGCIIANGTPDNRIAFLSDCEVPYEGYGYAIRIESTASSLCEISYCGIACAYVGILNLNKRLDNPIHDNDIWVCSFGIKQDGPMLSDVINNQIVYAEYAGIMASLADINGVSSKDAEILIQNNTVIGTYGDGIHIYGVEDANNAGEVFIINNLIAYSGSWAICCSDGWMALCMICNGFYANGGNVFGAGEDGQTSGGGLAGAGDGNSITIEDFNSYASREELWVKWKDKYVNGSSAYLFIQAGSEDMALVRDGNSMKYEYRNNESPYYSEAYADIADLPSQIGPDWTTSDVNTLALYFYRQAGNDAGEQMYVKLADGDEGDFNSVDDFDSYEGDPNPTLYTVWKDHYAPGNGSCAYLNLVSGSECGELVRDGNSMKYEYRNDEEPYYSEAYADIADLGIDPNWRGIGAKTLSLWFYGQADNDANEQMYVKLADSDTPVHTITVAYDGNPDDLREEKWHVWNINLNIAEVNDVNLAEVSRITIGFGDGWGSGGGTVYFDDIRLYLEYPPCQHTAKVIYNGNPESLMEERWHVWNIPFAAFNDVNLANVSRITIGFGDGNDPEPNSGAGVVYFDDIILGCGSFEEPLNQGPVYLDEDPFVYGEGQFFLKQDCPLIEAGFGYIDENPPLIGKTTDINSFPDSDIIDIGFHYPNWNYVNAGDGNTLSADLNQDGVVNFWDFALLAGGWQTTYNINDLNTMAEEWLRMGPMLANVIPSFDKEPSNLNGYVEMSIGTPDVRAYRIYALIDGRMYREFFLEMEGGPFIGINTERFANGPHSVKVVSIDIYGNVICSQVNEVIINNELSSVTMDEGYELGEPYHLYAFGSPEVNYIVDVNDDFNDTIVYSGNFTGDIQAVISAEAFAADNLIYDLMVRDNSSPAELKIYAMLFKKTEFNPNSPARMIISIGSADLDTKEKCAEVIQAVKNAAITKIGGGNTKYVITLPFGASTWDNVRRYLWLADVKIWVHFGHGDYSIWSSWNQIIKFNGATVSAFRNQRYLHSIEELGFREEPKLNFVYFHTCRGAHTTHFAEALGILPIEYYEGIGQRAFISWYGDIYYKDAFEQYNSYLILLWQQLGASYNLHEAKEETEKVEHMIRGAEVISGNLRDYGVSLDPIYSDQYIYFSYPDINP